MRPNLKMKSRTQLASDTADSPATPALPWCQAYQLAFPLVHASSEERGHVTWAATSPPNQLDDKACIWRGHPAQHHPWQHEGWQFTGDKLMAHQFGEECWAPGVTLNSGRNLQDTCKHDMRDAKINIYAWESLTEDSMQSLEVCCSKQS